MWRVNVDLCEVQDGFNCFSQAMRVWVLDCFVRFLGVRYSTEQGECKSISLTMKVLISVKSHGRTRIFCSLFVQGISESFNPITNVDASGEAVEAVSICPKPRFGIV